MKKVFFSLLMVSVSALCISAQTVTAVNTVQKTEKKPATSATAHENAKFKTFEYRVIEFSMIKGGTPDAQQSEEMMRDLKQKLNEPKSAQEKEQLMKQYDMLTHGGTPTLEGYLQMMGNDGFELCANIPYVVKDVSMIKLIFKKAHEAEKP